LFVNLLLRQKPVKMLTYETSFYALTSSFAGGKKEPKAKEPAAGKAAAKDTDDAPAKAESAVKKDVKKGRDRTAVERCKCAINRGSCKTKEGQQR
jgi:hypothetical protein